MVCLELNNQLPQTLFVDKSIGAQVVVLNGKTALMVGGRWHGAFPTLYRKYGCEYVWIYSKEGSETLEKTLESRFSPNLQLMGGFPNYRLVEKAEFLSTLRIQFTHTAKLDLSDLNLEELSASFRYLDKTKPLSMSLHRLILSGYAEEDLTTLAYLKNLEYLGLIRANRLASLKGVDFFSRLESLEIWYASHLKDIAAITGLRMHILRLDHCRVLEDIRSVAALKNLKTLILDDCPQIQSLEPVTHLNFLENLFFTAETNVKDGKIGQLATLPVLKMVAFKNRRHYDATREELRSAVGAGD